MPNYKYSVSLKMGGIMEKPEITAHNHQVIIAEGGKEAVKIYNSKYSCYYFGGSVDGVLGETTEPKTDGTPIDASAEKDKQEWFNKK